MQHQAKMDSDCSTHFKLCETKFDKFDTIIKNTFAKNFYEKLNFISESVVINPFKVNTPFLYPLKTSENFCFLDVFKGNRSGTLA